VWTGAITLPAIVGYLRVKAGRHYPSDVIVGYGVGALIGYLVPTLHKRTRDLNIDLISSDGGLGLVYHF
jgi:membrane-associated phospholipid phosphatase